MESICFVRAGLVNIYASFGARQLAPYYLLPAPNGNVNDVLQIKRPPCKQWPYLCVFHGRLCSRGHVVLIQLTRRPNLDIGSYFPETNDKRSYCEAFYLPVKSIGKVISGQMDNIIRFSVCRLILHKKITNEISIFFTEKRTFPDK